MRSANVEQTTTEAKIWEQFWEKFWQRMFGDEGVPKGGNKTTSPEAAPPRDLAAEVVDIIASDRCDCATWKEIRQGLGVSNKVMRNLMPALLRDGVIEAFELDATTFYLLPDEADEEEDADEEEEEDDDEDSDKGDEDDEEDEEDEDDGEDEGDENVAARPAATTTTWMNDSGFRQVIEYLRDHEGATFPEIKAGLRWDDAAMERVRILVATGDLIPGRRPGSKDKTYFLRPGL